MEYSTTQQRIAAIGHQPILKKSTFVIALAVFGIFSILAGIAGFVSAIISFSNATMPNLTSALLIEPVYNLSLGALIIVSSKVFAKGKLFSVWLYGGCLIIDSLYHTMMGYPWNYLFIGFGLLIIWQMLKFKNELELS